MDLLRTITQRRIVRLFVACAALTATATAQEVKPEVKIDGFGLFGNADLRRSLDLLELEDGPLTRQKIDDGAFLIISRLEQSGFLNAELSAHIVTIDGDEFDVSWTTDFVPQIERELEARLVKYTVEEGQLFYLDEVTFEGLQFMDAEDARDYFLPTRTLFTPKKARSYSPSILSNSKRNFVGALVAEGFADAAIPSEDIRISQDTGEVDVTLQVVEGPRYHVVGTQVRTFENGSQVNEQVKPTTAIYSRNWVEDQTRALRNESYNLGFPDTRVTSRITQSERVGERQEVTVYFEVRRGNKQYITDVVHRGATDTKLAVLERRADLKPGELLDITEVEKARRELSRAGIFSRVDLRYEQVEPNRRRVIFEYTNSERVQGQLLVGYGSYEQFRAGLLGKRTNLFGRAHSLNFEAIQSLKSTRGKVGYQIPELVGERIDGNFEMNYLDREEPTFDRKERGASVGLSSHLRELGVNLALDYAFDLKEAENVTNPSDLRIQQTDIASLSLRATRSRVDNVLYPTDGYEISSAIRYASPELGGESEFTRLETGASYHEMLDDRWIFHFSARGGIVTSPGHNRDAIHLNERFLVGGENTLRGFKRGEARPSVDGREGAEAYFLLNTEVEYPILDKLNAVIFVDAARVWDSSGLLDIYEDFYSVGLGLRYKTFVGPVRIEYGHNLDPRPADPKGTFHISIGFPF